MITADYEDECAEPMPDFISFYNAPITGQGVAECKFCDFKTTYWECAHELWHDCDN